VCAFKSARFPHHSGHPRDNVIRSHTCASFNPSQDATFMRGIGQHIQSQCVRFEPPEHRTKNRALSATLCLVARGDWLLEREEHRALSATGYVVISFLASLEAFRLGV
jgi:hypothetical protein